MAHEGNVGNTPVRIGRESEKNLRPRRDRDRRPTTRASVVVALRGKGEPVVAKRNVLNDEVVRGALVFWRGAGKQRRGTLFIFF